MENLSNRGKSCSLTSMVSFFYTFPCEWQDKRTMAFYDPVQVTIVSPRDGEHSSGCEGD